VFVALLLLVVDFTGRASSSPCGRGVAAGACAEARRHPSTSRGVSWSGVAYVTMTRHTTTHDTRLTTVCRRVSCHTALARKTSRPRLRCSGRPATRARAARRVGCSVLRSSAGAGENESVSEKKRTDKRETGLAPIWEPANTNKRKVKVKPAAQSSRLFLVFVFVVVDTHQRQRRGRMTGSAGGSSIV
jgi:hypothetical protein